METIDVICDFCKEPYWKKPVRVREYSGNTFVTCEGCKEKIKTFIPPKIEIKEKVNSNADKILKKEKDKFNQKMERIKRKEEEIIDQSYKRAVGNKGLGDFK